MNRKTSGEYNNNNKTLVFAVIAACMLAAMVFGLMYISNYSNRYHLQTASCIFTYHCAYHPFTMKGTIQVVSGRP